MFNRLFPKSFDNEYQGSKIALWLFGVVLIVKTGISLGCIFNGRVAASSADGIPLDTFPALAAQAVISLFALWGVTFLMISLVCVLVLIRYRSMIPFMFALLLVEHLSRRLILQFLPIVRTGTPPGFYINLGLSIAMIVGLALSLWRVPMRNAQQPI
ncbi:MAG: hypothetical protein PHX83_12455 [Acidobacteriia bacterium]|nr:hypothetical protein [Terriglobia bacterium]